MSEPIWVTVEEITVAHDKQLRVHGGPAGLRDAGALESALARPINQFHDGETEKAALPLPMHLGSPETMPSSTQTCASHLLP